MTTWTCTGTSCPWGDELSNHALAWPAAGLPVTTRLGYTTSPAVYLPAAAANGMTIRVDSGTANVFAGDPFESSHSFLATVSAGNSFLVTDLDDDEVLSVQSEEDGFSYHLTWVPPEEGPDAGVPVDAGPPVDAPNPSDGTLKTSQAITWICTGTPCPWGSPASGRALVWPAETLPVATRLGYTASAGIYLPAAQANGAIITVPTGEVQIWAGRPGDSSHRLIGEIGGGETLHVAGLASREVLSVQSQDPFTYRITLPPPGDSGTPPPDVLQSMQAFWRCNTPTCSGAAWTGAIITWPSWAAYQDNARSGDASRSVFSATGTPLFTYMGPWAHGCEVTAESGTVLIIEWQRGTNAWRETWLFPRQSHTIHLVPPENGAMIETYDGSPGFSVSLRNCTPQPL